jgi:hypothetical protein
VCVNLRCSPSHCATSHHRHHRGAVRPTRRLGITTCAAPIVNCLMSGHQKGVVGVLIAAAPPFIRTVVCPPGDNPFSSQRMTVWRALCCLFLVCVCVCVKSDGVQTSNAAPRNGPQIGLLPPLRHCPTPQAEYKRSCGSYIRTSPGKYGWYVTDKMFNIFPVWCTNGPRGHILTPSGTLRVSDTLCAVVLFT